MKHFKYPKSTLPAIKAGNVEVYSSSMEDLSSVLEEITQYENLKVGIGFIPAFRSTSWEQSQHVAHAGVYFHKSNTIWIQTSNIDSRSILETLRHELLHACQRSSISAFAEIEETAKAHSNEWAYEALTVRALYPKHAWDIEVPVWVLQHNIQISNYFIFKYLR